MVSANYNSIRRFYVKLPYHLDGCTVGGFRKMILWNIKIIQMTKIQISSCWLWRRTAR